MDRLDAMRTLVAVGELSSFAEAARRLRLSPAAVTRAVAQLERELGIVLFARTTRSVRLTEPGRAYLERCRTILAEVEDAAALARGEGAEPRGELTVAAPVVFGRLHVLPVIETLLRAHPALRVRLALSDRIVHLVEEGVDVAVRIGDLADSALTAVKVGEVRPVLVASPAYLAARGEPADLSALKGHDLIVFEGLARTQTWRFGQAEETLVRVAPKLAVNGADAALAAAEHGSGIASALSYQAAEAVSAGRLRIVLADHAPPAVPVSLVYPGQRLGSANVRAFLDVARPELKAGLARLAALLR